MSTSQFGGWMNLILSESVPDLELLLRRVMSTVWLTSGPSHGQRTVKSCPEGGMQPTIFRNMLL